MYAEKKDWISNQVRNDVRGNDVFKELRKAQLKTISATKQCREQPKLLNECFQNTTVTKRISEFLSCILHI